jgi:hypothetical protein
MSTQPALQSVAPAPQTQVPLEHVCPSPQPCPHVPQCAIDDLVSTHWPPQSVPASQPASGWLGPGPWPPWMAASRESPQPEATAAVTANRAKNTHEKAVRSDVTIGLASCCNVACSAGRLTFVHHRSSTPAVPSRPGRPVWDSEVAVMMTGRVVVA